MLRKRIITVIYTVAVVGMILGCATPSYIMVRLPHWPTHPDAIHVVPLNNHGTVHYMERIEGAWVDIFGWVTAPCFLLIWITIARRQWFSKSGPKSDDYNKARF